MVLVVVVVAAHRCVGVSDTWKTRASCDFLEKNLRFFRILKVIVDSSVIFNVCVTIYL